VEVREAPRIQFASQFGAFVITILVARDAKKYYETVVVMGRIR